MPYKTNPHSEQQRHTDLKQKLIDQHFVLDEIFQQAPIGISISFASNPDGTNIKHYFVNPKFEEITGRTRDELLKLGWAKITHPDDLELDMANFEKLKSGKINSYSMDKRYIRKDGTIVWVHMVVSRFGLINEGTVNHICLVQDITKHKTIEKELYEIERSKNVYLSHIPGLAYNCCNDQEWTMQYVSEGCFELTGYKPQSLLYNRDLSYNDIIAPEYRKLLREEWERVLEYKQPFKYEYEIITAQGKRKWVMEMGQGIYNELGQVEALEGIILDISEKKAIEEDLRFIIERDRWTGLYNRYYLETLLKKDAKKQEAQKRAIIGINLSSMQSLTMMYGFYYSQDLIKRVAETLRQYCTDRCLLFNTHENRFVYYLKGYKNKDQLLRFCETIAATLESMLAVERISAGIGIVEIEYDNGEDVDQLLRNLLIVSEKAMDVPDGEYAICYYDAEIEKQIIREERIKRELSKIANSKNYDGLFLQYQPIVDLKTNQICGFEALARLNCSELGIVMPGEFIPIAEETKFIIEMGNQVMQQAFYFLKKLKEKGYETIYVSINISVIQLLQKDFCNNLKGMINKMQIYPRNISLEITESVFSSNYQEVNRVLGELKDYGINIAIDDFGTGYSSLARERELNINCIKIDKYFIDKLMYIKPEEAITSDIISMAHRLGHHVVAEGIEHEKQKQYLLSCGCDKMQGFLISKPLEEDKAIEFLSTYASIN